MNEEHELFLWFQHSKEYAPGSYNPEDVFWTRAGVRRLMDLLDAEVDKALWLPSEERLVSQLGKVKVEVESVVQLDVHFFLARLIVKGQVQEGAGNTRVLAILRALKGAETVNAG